MLITIDDDNGDDFFFFLRENILYDVSDNDRRLIENHRENLCTLLKRNFHGAIV